MLIFLLQEAFYKCVDSVNLEVAEDAEGVRFFKIAIRNMDNMEECKVGNGTQVFLDIVEGTEDRIIAEKYSYNAEPSDITEMDVKCADASCRRIIAQIEEGDLLEMILHDNMFRSLVDEEIAVSFYNDEPLPQPYDYYLANGTFVIPISNVSFSFETYKNASTVIWNEGGEAITIWNDLMYHYVHIEGTEPACKSLNVEWVDKKEFLPDLTGYRKLNETQKVNGSSCDVYVRETRREVTSENATYFADSMYVERFFCIPLNNNECLPVKWETHGKNPYIYYYNEFDFAPDNFVYVVPDYCNETPLTEVPPGEQTSEVNYGYIRRGKPLDELVVAGESLPVELDHRIRGLSTSIKDEAACGSCWAFATAAMLEGRINAKIDRTIHPLVRVSEQQIISCSWRDNLGCSGGEVGTAVEQLIDDHGGRIPLEERSPYKSFESVCDDDAFTDEYGLITSVKALEKSKDVLKAALKDGPVAVATAVPTSFSWYTGGVYNDPECGVGEEAELVHAVTVIGWGVDEIAGEYWIVKNSWSNTFGVDGYIYISNEVDLCGILQEMVVAQITTGFSSADNIFGIVFGSIVAVTAAVLLAIGLWMCWKKSHEKAVTEEKAELLVDQE